MKKLYVGNLSYEATDHDLRGAFEKYGEVASANVIRDRESGRSRGFGFVEMPNDAQADEAIKGLNQDKIAGRTVTVNEARVKKERDDRGPRWG